MLRAWVNNMDFLQKYFESYLQHLPDLKVNYATHWHYIRYPQYFLKLNLKLPDTTYL